MRRRVHSKFLFFILVLVQACVLSSCSDDTNEGETSDLIGGSDQRLVDMADTCQGSCDTPGCPSCAELCVGRPCGSGECPCPPDVIGDVDVQDAVDDMADVDMTDAVTCQGSCDTPGCPSCAELCAGRPCGSGECPCPPDMTDATDMTDMGMSCAPGLTKCGMECVDVLSDAMHCGECDAACPELAGAQSECALEACSVTCEADRVDCDGDTLTTATDGDGCESHAEIGCQRIERVSLTGSMTGPNGSSEQPAISDDGRFIAFVTSGTDLVGGTPLGGLSVVLRDRVTHQNEGINVDELGALRSPALVPGVSDDGSLVVFSSSTDQLLASDTNGVGDVFLRDRLAATTDRVSETPDGMNSDDVSGSPIISADGRYILFGTRASNLFDPPKGNNVFQVVLRDQTSGAIEFISVSDAGVLGDQTSQVTGISADGRYVAFSSSSSNLVANDTNGTPDVFIRDRTLSTTTRASLTYQGFESSGGVGSHAFSRDGRYVLWSSSATDLIADDTNGVQDVFLRDLILGTTERVSVDTSGAQSAGHSGGLGGISVSSQGRYVVFESSSADLVANDTNGVQDIFLRDRQLNTTRRINVSATEEEANGISENPRITPDGRYVVFSSRASNLVSGDTNNHEDVFVVRPLTVP